MLRNQSFGTSTWCSESVRSNVGLYGGELIYLSCFHPIQPQQQGSRKVPSGCPGRVIFLAGRVTFKAYSGLSESFKVDSLVVKVSGKSTDILFEKCHL